MHLKLLLPLGVGLALATACGGDDDGGSGGTNDGAGGTTGTTTTSGGGSGGMGEGGASENVDCDPEGSGVCQNDMDCPAVASGDARGASQLCGLACLEDDDPGKCSVDCIVEQAEISAACAACYTGTVACATEKCFNECAADPASDECTDCQVDQGCRSDFFECSGLSD